LQADIERFRRETADHNNDVGFAALADRQRAEMSREIALMPLEMQVTKERYAERQRINANIQRDREAQARGELPPPRRPSQRQRELTRLKSQRTRAENEAAAARTAFELRYQQSDAYAALEPLRAQLRMLKGLIDRASRGEAVTLPDGFDNTQRPPIKRPR
jgi:hypothetical protein